MKRKYARSFTVVDRRNLIDWKPRLAYDIIQCYDVIFGGRNVLWKTPLSEVWRNIYISGKIIWNFCTVVSCDDSKCTAVDHPMTTFVEYLSVWRIVQQWRYNVSIISLQHRVMVNMTPHDGWRDVDIISPFLHPPMFVVGTGRCREGYARKKTNVL